MAYPNNFIKVTFGGSVYNNKDIWVCGVNFGSPSGDLNLEDIAEDIKLRDIPQAVQNWFTSQQAWISSQARLEWVKIAFIGADGKYALDPEIYDYDVTVTGAIGDGYHTPIPQHTTAITFESDVRRGAGRFGRIYPPLNGMIEADGRVSEANADMMADAAAVMLGHIGSALSMPELTYIPPIIASQKTLKHNEITKVKVGRVIDTQRSRRNAFEEEYSPVKAIVFNPLPEA